MSGQLIKRQMRWLSVALWMGLMFYLSHQQGSESSDLSSGITTSTAEFIQSVLPFIGIDVDLFHHLIRKSAHFMAYLVLGIFVMYALQLPKYKSAGWAFVICIVYAGTDEFHQLFVPGRSGQLTDVLIDSTGSAAGIGMYLVILLILGQATQKSRQ